MYIFSLRSLGSQPPFQEKNCTIFFIIQRECVFKIGWVEKGEERLLLSSWTDLILQASKNNMNGNVDRMNRQREGLTWYRSWAARMNPEYISRGRFVASWCPNWWRWSLDLRTGAAHRRKLRKAKKEPDSNSFFVEHFVGTFFFQCALPSPYS
jgi:hypothetical protein